MPAFKNAACAALLTLAATQVLAQGSAPGQPFRNRVETSALQAVPALIQDQIVQQGDRTPIPLTAALYTPMFPAQMFAGMNLFRDVRYGPAARNVLDVATAGALNEKRPVLVFVHGGGFGGGNKSSATSPFYDNITWWAASHRMVGVNVNYRYAPAAQWPAGIEDMRAVVAWLKQNVADYGGDPERIFFWGKSTGASHVADYIADVAEKGEAEQISGAIFTSGFYALGDEPAWENYYGSDVSLYPERNALPGLQKSATPLMATYAEFDGAQYRDQFNILLAAMNEARRPMTALYLRGHTHISETYAVGTGDDSLSGPVLDFIREHGGGKF